MCFFTQNAFSSYSNINPVQSTENFDKTSKGLGAFSRGLDFLL